MKVSATTRSALTGPYVLEWDTDFWGVKMGRSDQLDGVSQWAVANTIGLMALLVDADKPEEAQQAEQLGYRYMDTRVTLARRAGPCGASARLVQHQDIPALQEIARSAHRITRFYADHVLDDARCDDLYVEWITSSIAGKADIVLVAERDSQAVGYVTVHLGNGTASIGLIAVAEAYRNRGIGVELVSSAVNWAAGQQASVVTVVTQGRNIPAQRVFQLCGFRTTQTELWFHRWYNGKEADASA